MDNRTKAHKEAINSIRTGIFSPGQRSTQGVLTEKFIGYGEVIGMMGIRCTEFLPGKITTKPFNKGR